MYIYIYIFIIFQIIHILLILIKTTLTTKSRCTVQYNLFLLESMPMFNIPKENCKLIETK